MTEMKEMTKEELFAKACEYLARLTTEITANGATLTRMTLAVVTADRENNHYTRRLDTVRATARSMKIDLERMLEGLDEIENALENCKE